MSYDPINGLRPPYYPLERGKDAASMLRKLNEPKIYELNITRLVILASRFEGNLLRVIARNRETIHIGSGVDDPIREIPDICDHPERITTPSTLYELVMDETGTKISYTSVKNPFSLKHRLLNVLTAGSHFEKDDWKKQKNDWEAILEKSKKIVRENEESLDMQLEGIQIYQLSLSDVQAELGQDLELVDTKKPEQFIKAEDNTMLRAEAITLGADLIVNYQPGSAIGTPVRFRD